jgi:phosphoribosylpyrophosphate synthetase
MALGITTNLGKKVIKLKNIRHNNEIIVEPSVFPDGTSQVWNLPAGVFMYDGEYHITWYYESEAEFFQLVQLKYLLVCRGGQIKTMFIPFLPYSRQDKSISNDNTFALKPFLDLLLDTFAGTAITTLDVHNKEAYQMKNSIDCLHPAKYIIKSLIDSQADLVCYPDKGAKERYSHLIHMDHIIADKVRDQATGKITGHTLLETKHNLVDKNVLIVDDICDGGRTFTSMAKILKEAGVKTVNLYVTHGIFSMGLHSLSIGGIDSVYTTDSYIRNRKNLNMANTKVYKIEE